MSLWLKPLADCPVQYCALLKRGTLDVERATKNPGTKSQGFDWNY
jgi:hypothetical protein